MKSKFVFPFNLQGDRAFREHAASRFSERISSTRGRSRSRSGKRDGLAKTVVGGSDGGGGEKNIIQKPASRLGRLGNDSNVLKVPGGQK